MWYKLLKQKVESGMEKISFLFQITILLDLVTSLWIATIFESFHSILLLLLTNFNCLFLILLHKD